MNIRRYIMNRPVILLCILCSLGYSALSLIWEIQKTALPSAITVSALILIYLQQTCLLRDSEELYGIPRLVHRTKTHSKMILYKGCFFFLVPCTASFFIGSTESCILLGLLSLWLLARHINWAPKRVAVISAALSKAKNDSNAIYVILSAQYFWFIYVAILPYFYLLFLFLGNVIITPGENPHRMVFIVLMTAYCLSMVLSGLMWGIPGWKLLRASRIHSRDEFLEAKA